MFAALTSEPYPGLRPFDSEEVDIFFGRERQTDELLARLQKRRFLAVVGPSGCGKSSLVRAGMIPALESGFMIDTGSVWNVLTMRPGDRPLLNLATGLLDPQLLGASRGDGPEPALYLKAALKRGPLSLVEIVRDAGLCENANLLLLVDQFEELFRFRQPGTLDEAEAFVALLLATAAQRELPIYVVITMRSDFLGDCTLFHGLPETINDAQYLTPRLTREDCASAVVGPAKVFGANVEPALLNRLLNDVGPDPDQLPLMQHALMRMWERRSSACLTSDDYARIGGMKEALSLHGEEILASLSDEQRRIAEVMFRRLVDLRSGRRDTRTSARVSEIADIAGVKPDDVIAVVEAFRGRDCSFLTPREGTLEPDTLLDIGHESLIRKWQRFAQWVADEADAVSTYRRLRETALLWKRGKAGLWGTPDLELALAWKQRAQPTEAWASRYGEGGDLAIALEFLDASEARKRSEQQARARRLRRAIRWAQVSVSVAAVLVGSLLAYLYLYSWEHVEYFNSFEKKYGAPVGIGKLSRDDVSHRQASFRIVKQGKRGQVLRMEAVNARLEPTFAHGVSTYVEAYANSGQREPEQVVAWEFAYQEASGTQAGAREQVISETGYDSIDPVRRKVVWRFVYMPEDIDAAGATHIRRGYFVGRNGLPRARGTEQRTIVEIHYDELGRQERLLYRNRALRPTRGIDGAYGSRYVYDEQEPLQTREFVSLGPDGEPMIDELGNAVLRITKRDEFGNTLEAEALDTRGQRIDIMGSRGGWAIYRAQADSFGRITEQSYFDTSGAPILHGYEGYHRLQRKFDERGNIVQELYSDAAGDPVANHYLCHGYRYAYDERDRIVERTCIGADAQPTPTRDHFATERWRYDERDFLIETAYFDKSGQPTYYTDGDSNLAAIQKDDGYAGIRYTLDESGRVRASDFLDVDGEPTTTRQGYARVTTEYNAAGNATSKAFFGVGGAPATYRKAGYGKWRQDYDPYGNILHTRYFAAGVEDQRILVEGSNGADSGWIATYDANGNELQNLRVDTNDEPVTGIDGTAGYQQEYDSNDNAVRMTYIGAHREPVRKTNGVVQMRSTYDRLARNTGKKFFDQHGRPMLDSEVGAYGWRRDYDQQGRITQITYLNQDDQPIISTALGYATVRYEYAGNSHELSHERYFDEKGEPTVVASSNSAGYERIYDKHGNEVEFRNLDTNGALLDRRELVGGEMRSTYARATTARDARGNILEQAYYTAAGTLAPLAWTNCSRTVWSYGASGRMESESCFGSDNRLVVREAPGGYKKVLYTYDERGYAVEFRYLGAEDQPARVWDDRVPDGQFLTRNEYDRFGNLVQQTFFDENGRRVLGYSLYAEQCYLWTGTYDHAGQLTSARGECQEE